MFEVWLIGIVFTFGLLLAWDVATNGDDFKGFKGKCDFLLLTIVWPFTLGEIVGLLLADQENKSKEV